uniref:Arc-like DNA binding domain-containing protein n=1 Tax=Candidatus Kentrum eta TaxID=2126337 RepID=A0A450V9D9_9GAMM|nr:MAG: Arc-like DNA binding domain-containing protein [Candidatus Kentron sp. H]VFJ92291.1 MAG: Arc-like DNA binding domain-containing protein [Candidatus Kentron sp. H]VFK01432.1 MAG: Arc-like DNA binding domain-containing protein [Candidatus Kentron sp. H]
MPALTIKNIPDDLYRALKDTSEQNHRSINSQIIVCLERALLPKRLTPETQLARIRDLRATMPHGMITPKEIAQAIDEGRP